MCEGVRLLAYCCCHPQRHLTAVVLLLLPPLCCLAWASLLPFRPWWSQSLATMVVEPPDLWAACFCFSAGGIPSSSGCLSVTCICLYLCSISFWSCLIRLLDIPCDNHFRVLYPHHFPSLGSQPGLRVAVLTRTWYVPILRVRIILLFLVIDISYLPEIRIQCSLT